MKRAYFFLIVLGIISLCCGCGFFGDQEYSCDEGQIARIRIIRLEKYVEAEYRYDYSVLSEIENRTAFIEQLNNMTHSVNWGEPGQFQIGYLVIRIDYQNGDYDLIHPSTQWFNRSGVNQNGYFFFDQQEFDALVNSVLPEQSGQ